jgi:lipopolysaccharide/colanic/teichoic acid biosynthesis glycosyltransferase
VKNDKTTHRWASLALKRVVDVVAATAGIILLSPLLLAAAAAVRLTSRGPVLFLQTRIGRNMRPFKICKFRTMVDGGHQRGAQVTAGRDPRITPVGKLLRKTKIDELPQLFNVVMGDMSLVGPRPEVPRYVDMFRDDFEYILEFRPGITDLASIEYRDEQEVLGAAADPEAEYVSNVLPRKLDLCKRYVREWSLLRDFALILKTLMCITPLGRRRAEGSGGADGSMLAEDSQPQYESLRKSGALRCEPK